jgi:hypothetical protein
LAQTKVANEDYAKAKELESQKQKVVRSGISGLFDLLKLEQ